MGLFKRKSRKEKLDILYRKKLADAHRMSLINRSKSDQLIFEAEQILKVLENED